MKSAFVRVPWLISVILLCFFMCVTASAETEIDGIYLTGDIDVAAGKAPSVITASEDAPYTVSSVWEKYDSETKTLIPVTGVFELGCTYYLNINIQPEDGYCFPVSGTPLYLNGEYRDTLEYSESGLSCIFRFDTDDYVRSVTLTGISEVAVGNSADLSALSAVEPFCSAEGEFLVFDVSTGEFVHFEGSFAQGYEYRLSLKLVFESGCYPSPDAFVVNVLGREYYDSRSIDGIIYCDIRYTLGSVIEYAELLGITDPVAGEDVYLGGLSLPAGVRYSVESAAWSLSGVRAEGKFDYGKTYGLEITLKAEAGYTFAESVSVCINGEKPSARSGSGEYLYIYEEYSTDALISTARIKCSSISDGASSDSFKVTAYLAPNPKFTVEWELVEHVIGGESCIMSGESFHAAGIYEIRITLRAKAGSCFSESTKLYETTKALTADSVSAHVVRISIFRPLAQKLESISLSGAAAPRGGMLPATDSITVQEEGYLISGLRYFEYDAQTGELLPIDGCFKAGRTYVLKAEVVCDFGWTFAGKSTAFYIDGELCPDAETDYTSAVAYRYFTAEAGECAGDVDHDLAVTNTDITLLVRLLSGWQTEVSFGCADLDKNGILNNRDVISLIKRLSN